MNRRSAMLAAVVLCVSLAALAVGLVDAGQPGPPTTGRSSASAPGPSATATARPHRRQPPGPDPIHAPADPRPNIVLISSDDQRLDEMPFLPQTRALLGDAGITFDNAITPHPLCCPARAELMSGQYAQNNGVRTNWGPQGGYPAFDPDHTVGTDLHRAGYNTAFLGKHLNGYNRRDGRDPGWTIFDPSTGGYGDYYDFGMYGDGQPHRVDGYFTSHLDQKTTEYAHRLSSYDAPFFMWVSHYAPHSSEGGGDCEECGKSPPKPSPEIKRLFDLPEDQLTPEEQERVHLIRTAAREEADRILADPAWNEADVSDKQHTMRDSRERGPDDVRRYTLKRGMALASLDDAVAHLVEQLGADGELANTYVGFVTDNGYLLGEHRYFGKILGYEESVRTPMLFRGPGIEPGTTTPVTSTLVDLPATFEDIAGAKADRPLDGISIEPLLHGRPLEPHPSGVLIQAGPYRQETKPRGWYYRGLRTARYTYLHYFDGWTELYDRRVDPDEISSVSDDPRYARVLAELARRTRALSGCAGPEECNPHWPALPAPGGGRRGSSR